MSAKRNPLARNVDGETFEVKFQCGFVLGQLISNEMRLNPRKSCNEIAIVALRWFCIALSRTTCVSIVKSGVNHSGFCLSEIVFRTVDPLAAKCDSIASKITSDIAILASVPLQPLLSVRNASLRISL